MIDKEQVLEDARRIRKFLGRGRQGPEASPFWNFWWLSVRAVYNVGLIVTFILVLAIMALIVVWIFTPPLLATLALHIMWYMVLGGPVAMLVTGLPLRYLECMKRASRGRPMVWS